MEGLFSFINITREERRKWFKENHKKLGFTWPQFNSQIPKRQPIRSDRNKALMGQRRRNGLA